jgi:hypothetical protein
MFDETRIKATVASILEAGLLLKKEVRFWF